LKKDRDEIGGEKFYFADESLRNVRMSSSNLSALVTSVNLMMQSINWQRVLENHKLGIISKKLIDCSIYFSWVVRVMGEDWELTI